MVAWSQVLDVARLGTYASVMHAAWHAARWLHEDRLRRLIATEVHNLGGDVTPLEAQRILLPILHKRARFIPDSVWIPLIGWACHALTDGTGSPSDPAGSPSG